MPLNKRHLQIHTTYFDEQSNSIFKESLQESSSQGSDLALHKPLTNSKSSSLPHSQNVLYRTIQPQERTAEHHFGPDSQKLLDEFRQIVEGTPQIKSEVYESLVGPKEIRQGLQGRESLYRKISKASQEGAVNERKQQQQKQRSMLAEINFVQSQQYMASVKGYSPPDNLIQSRSNLQPQTSFGKFSSKPISGTIQQLYHEQNQLKSNRVIKTKQQGNQFANVTTKRQAYQDDYVRDLQDKLVSYEKYEDQRKVKNGLDRRNRSFKLDCGNIIGGYVDDGFNLNQTVQYRSGHNIKQQSKSRHKIQRQLRMIKQEYDTNISNLSNKLNHLSDHPYLQSSPHIDTIYKKKQKLQHQRVTILNNIWSRLSSNPQHNQFQQTLHWQRSNTPTTGGRIKGKMTGKDSSKYITKRIGSDQGLSGCGVQGIMEGEGSDSGWREKVQALRQIEVKLRSMGNLLYEENDDRWGKYGSDNMRQEKQVNNQTTQNVHILIQQPNPQPQPQLNNYAQIFQQLTDLRSQLHHLKQYPTYQPIPPLSHQTSISPHYISKVARGQEEISRRDKKSNGVPVGLMTPIRKLEGRMFEFESEDRVREDGVDGNGNGNSRGKTMVNNSMPTGYGMVKGNRLNYEIKPQQPNLLKQTQYLPVSHPNPHPNHLTPTTTSHSQSQYYPYTRSLILDQVHQSQQRDHQASKSGNITTIIKQPSCLLARNKDTKLNKTNGLGQRQQCCQC